MTPPIAPYAPPRSDKRIDLKLDANEGRPPPAAVLESLNASDLCRYPSTLALERRLAERLGVAPERVVVTAGGDEALDRICRVFLGPGRVAVMTSPTFEMIPRYARAAGAGVVDVAWSDGPFPTRNFCGSLGGAHGVCFVVSPNNPTGGVASAEDLCAVSHAAGDRPVCADLAYTEYADEDLTPIALSLPNVIVVRTLSKAWGLAGLRVGYAIAPSGVADRMRRAAGPYPVSGPSLAIAGAWLERGEEHVRESVAAARRGRTILASLLRSLGVACVDSQANFVLARVANAWGVADRLADAGIGVRRFQREGPLGELLRITCPCDDASFQRLASALRDAIRETRP